MVGETWWDSVMLVLAHGPPTGDVEHNRKTAADLAEEHPLQALFPKVRLGGDGLPRYSPRTDEDRLDDQLTDMETMSLQWQGELMAEALRRASAKHDPSVEDVLDGLRSVGCEGATAAAISRVVRRFTDGDYEAATYTGIPLVERQCRGCCSRSTRPSIEFSASELRGPTPVSARYCPYWLSGVSTGPGTGS